MSRLSVSAGWSKWTDFAPSASSSRKTGGHAGSTCCCMAPRGRPPRVSCRWASTPSSGRRAGARGLVKSLRLATRMLPRDMLPPLIAWVCICTDCSSWQPCPVSTPGMKKEDSGCGGCRTLPACTPRTWPPTPRDPASSVESPATLRAWTGPGSTETSSGPWKSGREGSERRWYVAHRVPASLARRPRRAKLMCLHRGWSAL
mmetsp:Transcript_45337/g.119756  ORF Transcript_45337/g.119756 Transcript_45337/m.119756 type:complete len:202 (-) Transcript_45337:59-664(-)